MSFLGGLTEHPSSADRFLPLAPPRTWHDLLRRRLGAEVPCTHALALCDLADVANGLLEVATGVSGLQRLILVRAAVREWDRMI